MSITVNKSKNIQLDDVTENALTSVLERLGEQKEHVKSVTILANFSIDTDTALHMNVPLVTQGLVVCVAPTYQLSTADMSWFHPSIGRGRSMFSVETPTNKLQLQQVALTLPTSSVGEFTNSHPDEFGCEDVSYHVVVDTAPNLSKLYSSWLSQGLTAGEVGTQWKQTSFDQTKSIPLHSSNHRTSIVQCLSPGKNAYSDTVNDILTDMTHVYFTNDCVKQSSKQMLIKSSALGGYRLYAVDNTSPQFLPASLGSANTFYDWDDMNSKNVSRIAESCSWKDDLSFNTQVMRPPSLRSNSIRNMEDEYKLSSPGHLVMRLAHFTGSSQIVDKMNPVDVLQLTPSTVSEYITAPIDPSHPVFAHLVANIVDIQAANPTFQLINPKYLRGNRLKLPRDVYKQIV